jgi:U3 small nucleolar RNA-associated protein 21
VYDCEDLQLEYLSRTLPGEIGAVLGFRESSIVSVGNHIMIFHKMKELAQLVGHSEDVVTLVSLGDSFLVSVSKLEVLVWQLPNVTRQMDPLSEPLAPVRRLEIGFSVSSVISVPTYVNKMLFAGTQGELELWNINKGQRIYAFKSTKRSEACEITALAAAPVLDVVGLGFADGTISVVNLKSDEVVMTLNQKEHGGVTSMSFRHDSVGGQLVTGTERGDLVVWDLNKRCIHSFHQKIHPGGVSTTEFLDNLPLMISAGRSDNALMVHIFDLPDHGCRVLRERRGFTADLSIMMHYGEHDLVVAGTNSQRHTSEVGRLNLIQSHQNRVWSQKNLHNQTAGKASLMPWRFRNMHQLPAVKSMSLCEDKLRHYDWPTVITAHEGLPDAYVWNPHQEALVNRMLIVPWKSTTGARAPAVVQVAVSTCGNYGVVGLETGEIHRFNLQSCYHRGLVGSVEPTSIKTLKFLSSRDLMSADAQSIKLWKVVPRPALVSTLTCVSDIDQVEPHGFLCAVAHKTERLVSIIDLHADKRVRKISTTDQVTSMTWAEGGKWIAIATKDKRMVVYEIPTAMVIDRVEFESPVKCMRFMYKNAHLVTSHEDGQGSIRVWQNIALLHGPGPVTDHFLQIEEHEREDENPKRQIEPVELPVKRAKVSDEVVVYGGTRWQQILKLDEIKERNKPRKAAEKPKSAPFFLPVKYQGVQPVFAAPIEDFSSDDLKAEPKPRKTSEESGFIRLLREKKWDSVESHLLNLSPSGVHICLSELEDDEDGLNGFIEFLAHKTAQGYLIDLIATLTSLFLKQYGSELRGRSAFETNLEQLWQAMKSRQSKFAADTDQLQCLVKVSAALQLHR